MSDASQIPENWIEYIRTNKDKYPIEVLKNGLKTNGGATPEQAELAVRLALEPPPLDAVPLSSASAPAPATDSFPGFFDRIRGVIVSPAEFFRAMPKTGGVGEAFLFLIGVSAISAIARMASALLSFGPLARSAVFFLIAGPLAIGWFIFIAILSFIASAIAYVFWQILGSKEPYETSYRCFAFGSAASLVLTGAKLVPIHSIVWSLAIAAGGVVYWALLCIVMSVEVHGIERRKATVAFSVVAAVVLLWPILMFGALFGSRGGTLWQRLLGGESPNIGIVQPVPRQALPPINPQVPMPLPNNTQNLPPSGGSSTQ